MSENKNQKSKVVGILGGGQLAMMLAESAKSLNVKTLVFAAKADDPASHTADKLFIGQTNRPEDLKRFFDQVDLVIFENEFFDPEFQACAEETEGLACIPDPSVMTRFANKLNQKKMLSELNIPTADYDVYSQSKDLKEWISHLKEKFPSNCVIKWAHGGYDGKGNFVLNTKCLDTAHEKEAITFIQHAIDRNVDVYAEVFTDFSHEVALISAHSINDKFLFYPLVFTKQVEGVCSEVKGPAYNFDISSELQKTAQDFAEKLSTSFHLYGVFAIEFFLTKSGELLVNEIAPRVHNSGHYSQEGAPTSQFENHLRAVLGMELHTTVKEDELFAMVNILGPKSYTGPVQAPSINLEETFLHWYEKKEARPGRKLGHINIVGHSVNDINQKCALVSQAVKKWQSELSSKGST